MTTKETTFDVSKLNFSTLDASEAEFFTIEYDDPDFSDALGILGGKVYLWVNDLLNKVSADLWIEGEPVMEMDEEAGGIVLTGEEKEPYFLGYNFTAKEMSDIQLCIIQHFHSMLCFGEEVGGKAV